MIGLGAPWFIIGLCALIVSCPSDIPSMRAPCEGVSCQSRGLCLVQADSPYCACEPGYHPLGLACVPNDPDNPCLGVSCNLFGTCHVEVELPQCICESGYEADNTGLLCFRSEGGDADGGDSRDADVPDDTNVMEVGPDSELDAEPDVDRDAEGDTLGGPLLIAAGGEHVCSLDVSLGTVRCWGRGLFGQLGYGDRSDVEQDVATIVDVGGFVTQIAAGAFHSCALLEENELRCWGSGEHGRLGNSNTSSIGDTEVPSEVPFIIVGGLVAKVSAGFSHTCALLQGGMVRCWGNGAYGQLGYGNTENIGDDEFPSTAGDVQLGGVATDISAGAGHTCAIIQGGYVRCWGFGLDGRIGTGQSDDVGDNEPPNAVEVVALGGVATGLSAWGNHTCVLLQGGLRCFGNGEHGQLGYGDTENIGDNESPENMEHVDVGGTVVNVSTGWWHTCAVLLGGNLRCWGRNVEGQLGYDSSENIGDNESPRSAGDVPIEGLVSQIAAGGTHTCFVIGSNEIRCVGGL